MSTLSEFWQNRIREMQNAIAALEFKVAALDASQGARTTGRDLTCHKCSKHVGEIGGYLARVNEKGVDGIWECRPNCTGDLADDALIVAAIGVGPPLMSDPPINLPQGLEPSLTGAGSSPKVRP